MRGIKLVVLTKDGYFSAMSRLNKSGAVPYSIGAPTVPKDGCGPLAVFSCIKDANTFLFCNAREELVAFECSYEAEEAEDKQSLWQMIEEYKDECMGSFIPWGTRFASSVTITRELQRGPFVYGNYGTEYRPIEEDALCPTP